MRTIDQKITTDPKEFIPGKNSKEFIIIHHTGSKAPYENIIKFFLRPDYLSVHYVVAKDGRITQLVEDDDVAFHAGVSSWNGKKNLNYHSIGIEIHGDGYEFTDAQRDSVVELCSILMFKYQIGHRNVLRHADIAPKRKWDVGPSFYVPRWGSWPAFQDHLNSPLKEDAFPAELRAEMEFAVDQLKRIEVTNGSDLESPATRGQVILMLNRLYQHLKK